MFIVNFKGNGLTSQERTFDMCLLRSAELCNNVGYKYFVIVEESSDIQHYQFKTPEISRSNRQRYLNEIAEQQGFSPGGEWEIMKKRNRSKKR